LILVDQALDFYKTADFYLHRGQILLSLEDPLSAEEAFLEASDLGDFSFFSSKKLRTLALPLLIKHKQYDLALSMLDEPENLLYLEDSQELLWFIKCQIGRDERSIALYWLQEGMKRYPEDFRYPALIMSQGHGSQEMLGLILNRARWFKRDKEEVLAQMALQNTDMSLAKSLAEVMEEPVLPSILGRQIYFGILPWEALSDYSQVSIDLSWIRPFYNNAEPWVQNQVLMLLKERNQYHEDWNNDGFSEVHWIRQGDDWTAQIDHNQDGIWEEQLLWTGSNLDSFEDRKRGFHLEFNLYPYVQVANQKRTGQNRAFLYQEGKKVWTVSQDNSLPPFLQDLRLFSWPPDELWLYQGVSRVVTTDESGMDLEHWTYHNNDKLLLKTFNQGGEKVFFFKEGTLYMAEADISRDGIKDSLWLYKEEELQELFYDINQDQLWDYKEDWRTGLIKQWQSLSEQTSIIKVQSVE